MEDKLDSVIGDIWVAILAYLFGRTMLFGEPLCLIAFLIAVSLLGKRSWLCCISGIASVFLSCDIKLATLYAISMVGITVILNVKNIEWMKKQTLVIITFSCLWYVLMMIFGKYIINIWNEEKIQFSEICLKAATIFSLGVLFVKAFEIIKNDFITVAINPEATISFFAFAGLILYSLPQTIIDIQILMPAVMLSILYMGYRFGIGTGLGFCVIAGFVLGYRLDDMQYMMTFTITLIVTLGISDILRLSKYSYALVFVFLYILLGITVYEYLLGYENLLSLVSAVVIFELLPVRYLTPIDNRVRRNELGIKSPEWANMVLNRVNTFASALKRVDYTMADAVTGISFKEIGEMIDSFSSNTSKQCEVRKTVESKLIQELRSSGIEMSSFVILKNGSDRYEIYTTLRCTVGRIVSLSKVKKILEDTMRVDVVADENNRKIVGKDYRVYLFREKPVYLLEATVRMISKYESEPSGDNYYIGEIASGQKLIMISDGMGSGADADENSQNLIDTMQELLGAGVEKNLAIKVVNTYLSRKNKGELFATMDMLIFDEYTGRGCMFKQGAATTYIKRREWIEEIKSTSLPMGIDEECCCENTAKKFYDNDIIIMLSDGVYEDLIYENKEDYIRNTMLKIDSDNVDEIADVIQYRLKKNSRKSVKDDATIIVCRVVKRM